MTSFTRLAATVSAGVLALAGLTACDDASNGAGGTPGTPGTLGSSAAPTLAGAKSAALDAPDTSQLWTSAMVIQTSPTTAPVLCIGAVLESYPPQCAGGVGLVGWDWADITGETVHGPITWIDTVYVTGTYADGTFTLKRPPSDFPPAGAVVEAPTARTPYPQLCDDPLRGAADSSASGVRADNRAKDALSKHLETMDGYVGSWVSGRRGASMNVLVTGDAERAHAEARTLWAGNLCVAQRDVATHANMLAAQKALMSATVPAHQCLSSGLGPDGQLGVGVTLADPATVAEIHRVVAPWLSPDDVKIWARLRPLSG
ncbi:hypothetical protein JNB_07479 [Janibacter sp. HTCC2649]|uniref:hypothetical protein n=1 Tax=Janibacter sp. HTCC2649 TaxID=313589 RepID=UPI0000670C16|nr:hypothetical protein [Janibacter sp. HTCC2649]EAP99993.1 hypothetical protein JNB_07479 [Janibacter sp. HTCC2649]